MRESESATKRNEAQEKGEMLMCVYIYCVLSVSGWILGKRREGEGEEALATPHHNQPSLSLTHDLKIKREGVRHKEEEEEEEENWMRRCRRRTTRERVRENKHSQEERKREEKEKKAKKAMIVCR